MKKYLFLILPIFLYSANFSDLIKSVDNNLLVKSKKEQSRALKKLLNAKKAKNYPSVDFQLKTVRLYDTPTTTFNIPGLLPNTSFPIGTRTNIDAGIAVTYPLFTGFAITKSIEIAKLKLLKNKLETKELKRELYIKIASLYSGIYSLNQAIKASNEAKTAIEKSYKKAKGLYKNGFINISNLYKIEAKKYEISSSITSYKERKNSLINDLLYITDIKTDVKKLPNFNLSKKDLINTALNQRADIKALKTQLAIDNKDIALAKSKYYPKIAIFGAIKRQGDDFSLDGNGYSNADQSYIGATLSYNIFDGGEKSSEKQAALAKKVARKLYFADYKRGVIKNIKNALRKLKSLKSQLKAANKQIEASASYYQLTNGRFENSLASGDELSRAIANLAKARAKKENIKSKIFLQYAKISLMAGNDYFLKNM